MDIPDCPAGWQELWIGFSFLMVSKLSHLIEFVFYKIN